MKNNIKWEKSNRIYKFGGGEKRESKGVVMLPCNLSGMLNVIIKTEVVDAELPLLLENTTLKKAKTHLDIENGQIEMLNIKLKMDK